uniref:Amino acid transporter n=1 Tax=Macrostomum lignano TaxID=282301 RepID=A0A1I8I3B6_9PLAT
MPSSNGSLRDGKSRGCSRPEPCSADCCRTFLRRNVFVLCLILGVAAGIGLGVGLRYAKPVWTARELAYYKFPGELLLRMLQMVILPLVITSMISGMSSLGRNASSWIGLRAVVYYMCTTLFAVIIGIVLVVSIHPGRSESSETMRRQGSSKTVNAVDSLLDLIRNAFPDNVMDACIRKVQTSMKFIIPDATTTAPPTVDPNATASNSTAFTLTTTNIATTVADSLNASSGPTPKPTAAPVYDYVPKVERVEGSNLLGIIVFSLAFGVALSRIGERGHVARQFFDGCSEAVLVVVKVVIWFTPIGIIFLISGKIIEMENVVETLSQLGLYSITVISGLVIHGFIVLPPLIYLIVVRRNPFRYMFGCMRAILTAVSTASSSATLPVSLYCIEEVNGVSKMVSRFVLPVGATINMDGTALYEAVASVFIAQVNGITLDFAKLVTISLTATAAAVGAAGVPEAGLVTMVIVLTAVGLPTDDALSRKDLEEVAEEDNNGFCMEQAAEEGKPGRYITEF